MLGYRKVAILRRVLVNLDDGQTAIEGLLVREVGALLVLREATLLTAGADPAPLDGETYIDKARVLFVQAPGERR